MSKFSNLKKKQITKNVSEHLDKEKIIRSSFLNVNCLSLVCVSAFTTTTVSKLVVFRNISSYYVAYECPCYCVHPIG